MGERKTLNKYYPPNFDPSKIPRRRQPANHQIKVRTMLPMRVRCQACGSYMSEGTKINARKQKVTDRNYLGIQIFRFSFNCSTCAVEMSYVTDPKNSDHAVEFGAKRCYESWRAEEEEFEKKKGRKDAKAFGDPLKLLENRTADSKREMDIVTALDELKSMNSRRATVTVDDMLRSLQERAKQDEEKKSQLKLDEALVRSVFKERRNIDKDIVDDDYNQEKASASASGFQVDCKVKPTTCHSRVPKTTKVKSNSGRLLLCQQADTEDNDDD